MGQKSESEKGKDDEKRRKEDDLEKEHPSLGKCLGYDDRIVRRDILRDIGGDLEAFSVLYCEKRGGYCEYRVKSMREVEYVTGDPRFSPSGIHDTIEAYACIFDGYCEYKHRSLVATGAGINETELQPGAYIWEVRKKRNGEKRQ